jgi:iron(III) transport system substrate-binding protein
MNRRKFSRRTFLAGSTAAIAIAAGCNRNTTENAGNTPENPTDTTTPESGATPASPSGSNGEINLYSSRHYDTDQALYDGFTAATGIRINLIEAEADELIERIQAEGANSPADVLITVDAGRLWRADQAGILQPTTAEDAPELYEIVPETLRHPDGHWFGFSKRARVLMYRKETVQPADLSSYEDLASDKWKGRVLVRSSENIYNQSLVGELLAVHGPADTETWVQGLVANFARPPEGNDTAQIQAVAAGVGDVAIANSYYLARLGSSDKPEDQEVFEKVGLFFPNQGDRGTHVNISGGGVVKTAPNPEGAKQFLAYLASPDAQKIFAEGNFEYPVNSTVAIAPILEEFGTFKESNVEAATFAANNEEALKLTDRAGWR